MPDQFDHCHIAMRQPALKSRTCIVAADSSLLSSTVTVVIITSLAKGGNVCGSIN